MTHKESDIERLVDEAILEDVPNTVLDIYEQETGLEPVPEEGGHTDAFERWFADTVQVAYTVHDRKTVEGLKSYFSDRRNCGPDFSRSRTVKLAYNFASYGLNGAGMDETAAQKEFGAECVEVAIRLMNSDMLDEIASPDGNISYTEAQLTDEWKRLLREARQLSEAERLR